MSCLRRANQWRVSAWFLNVVWLAFAHRLRREGSVRRAMRFFRCSIAYLALGFTEAAIDALLSATYAPRCLPLPLAA